MDDKGSPVGLRADDFAVPGTLREDVGMDGLALNVTNDGPCNVPVAAANGFGGCPSEKAFCGAIAILNTEVSIDEKYGFVDLVQEARLQLNLTPRAAGLGQIEHRGTKANDLPLGI